MRHFHLSGGDENGPHGEVDEVHLFLYPFAQERFWDLIGKDLPDRFSAVILKQCCEGISYLHGKGLIHRDIKPANMTVVSRSPSRFIIIDFGVATWETTSTNHMVGTIRYLAPEVLALKRKTSTTSYNQSVDVWGLGVSFYQ